VLFAAATEEASSFAHVAANAPEAYVKPEVLEKGKDTVHSTAVGLTKQQAPQAWS
jgi:hypothetical protein